MSGAYVLVDARGAGGKYGVGTMAVFSPTGQDGIFISYRNADVKFPADRLHGQLAHHFSSGQVFYAPDGIRPAEDFLRVINKQLRSCRVLLAVIGDRWLTAVDRFGRRRLDNPQDYVRMEIETALALPNVEVVPILIDGVPMPRAEELPHSLAGLTRLNAVEVSLRNFDSDVDRLIKWLYDHIPRTVIAVAPIALSIPLFVFALRFAGYSLDRHWFWVALVSAVLGAAVATVDFRRSKIWVIAIETALIWCIANSIYKLNFWNIRDHLPMNHGAWLVNPGGKYLAILSGTVAIIYISMLLVLARRFRKRKHVVHVLLPVFLACMAAALALKTFGYVSSTNGHASGWILLAALVVNIFAPLVVLRRKLYSLWDSPSAGSGPGQGADTAVRPAREDMRPAREEWWRRGQ